MNRLSLLLGLLLLMTGSALAGPIDSVTLQGYLANAAGESIDGTVDVVATLYADSAGTTSVHTQSLSVDVDAGFFTATLTGVDLEVFADNDTLFLGLAVDGDPEMDLIAIATAPWAGAAAHAGDADALGGVPAADYRLSTDPVDWTEIVGAPLTLGTLPCGDGEFLAYDDANSTWACAAAGAETDPVFGASAASGITNAAIGDWDSAVNWGDHASAGYLTSEVDGSVTNEINTALALNGSVLEVTDGAGALTVDLAGLGYLTAEIDDSVVNEINTALALNGSLLQVTDSNGTLSVDLAGLGYLTAADLTGYLTAEVDGSVTNEVNTALGLTGSVLSITDSNGILSVDLDAIGYLTAADVTGFLTAEVDGSVTNEVNTVLGLNGTNLQITDSAGTLSVDLSSLGYLTATDVTGFLTSEVDGSVTNEINTALGLNGSNLEVTDSNGTLSVDLAGLGYLTSEVDGSITNEINTALGLNGSNLEVTDSNGTLSVDLAGTFATTAAANAAYVNVSGDTMTGELTMDALLRAQAGSAATDGITFDVDPGGGSGDAAWLRYYATSGEDTRFEIGISNDAADVLALNHTGDAVVVDSSTVSFGKGLTMSGCPSGFNLRDGNVCTRWDQNWGELNWTNAQLTCQGLNARVCTYRDVLLSWGSSTNHPDIRNADFLGDFVADDDVLDVNNQGNKSNFEGDRDKSQTEEFVCCINPL